MRLDNDNHITPIEFRPCIVALAGPPLSGKTTIGTELSRRTNLTLFDVDQSGIDLEGLLEPGIKHPFVNSMRMAVKYTYNHYLAGLHLAEGKPVIVTATYSHHTYEYLLREILTDTYQRLYQSPESLLRIFLLDAPVESLSLRIAERTDKGSVSDVNTLEHATSLRRRFVPIEGDDVVKVNTALPIEANIDQILTVLGPFRN